MTVIPNKRLCLVVALLAVVVSSVYSQRQVSIKILQTSDVHGALFPFDYINNRSAEASLAQISTFVKQERENRSQHVILLDNGDILQGQPSVYFSNYIDTLKENIVSRIYKFMRYDAVTIGNHDIETSPAVYRKVEQESGLPWLSANAVCETDGRPAFKPYVVINRDGIKVAVLGLTTPGIPKWLPGSFWPGMRFDDMVESAKYWVGQIKRKEKPHVIVGLFHSGHNASYGNANPDEPRNENASLLVAQQVPGFDVILIGHDHDRLNRKFLNVAGDSVLVLDPTSSARLISEATIALSLDRKGRVIGRKVTGRLIETRQYKSDSLFIAQFKDDALSVADFVNHRIGLFTREISSEDAYFGPSAFIDFIHAAQLRISHADVSFAAPLSFVSTINQGDVTVSDMFKLYRFENFLYTINLTGYEVDKYLEYSYSHWFNTMQSDSDNLIAFKKRPEGSIELNKEGRAQLATNYYNFDSAAGIVYTVDASKPNGDKVTIRSMMDGSRFEMDRTYRVAVNSYRGNGGGGHLTEGCGISPDELPKRMIASTAKDLRYYIMRLIETEGVITPITLNCWKVIPEEWAREAIHRDKVLMFGKDKE